jgi:hypothetical protein
MIVVYVCPYCDEIHKRIFIKIGRKAYLIDISWLFGN